MQFDKPATTNPIDQLKVIGQPIRRIDGQLKATGRAMYAYEWHDPNLAYLYGYPVGSAIAKGRVKSIDTSAAKKADGVLAVVTTLDVGKFKKGKYNTANLFGGDEIQHYHQAVAVVIAKTFEQARAAASLVKVGYAEDKGTFDLADAKDAAAKPKDANGSPPDTAVGDFQGAFRSAPVKLDETYTTPDQSHSMMEPHASIAVWDGDELTVWTSSQMIDWWRTDLATTLGIEKDKVHLMSPFVVEVGVDVVTGETRIRRMLAVCAAGRILNPITARSQVIGAMTMGAGGALSEELAVDTRHGFFVNHDLAGYEVPVHADIPHQEVIFMEETDPMSSPMKAKGVGELGLCGVSAAIANAIHNATGMRVRHYPITLDKLIGGLPEVA
ncbi:molybdopterin-dependent oxidoreductase [Rhizobium lusitanum]|uniref:Molybdopterin-dependent oxidoreductase n=1 Tax=Rhizobium lusitanum TaxID=293958 RepID=A0A6L9UEG6_9HYPH|nr:molybdopterin cofactor-binding domain-containing protein [Rhizobium lusitanum]NEI72430.1 molybdopterin-dependent oxidoreductase [Rhizobium lusitanum]